MRLPMIAFFPVQSGINTVPVRTYRRHARIEFVLLVLPLELARIALDPHAYLLALQIARRVVAPVRSVKVQQSLRHQDFSHLDKSPKLYPWIKLSGLWIEHAGFLPGQQVRVTVEHGKLIITAD
jgi:toxic protein SymE